MLEIFVLGTSAGIPSLNRNAPCLAFRWKGEVMLFDVGECCQKSLMKHKVGYGSISSVFISHLHLDHFLGLFGLIETLRLTTDIEKLNIYAPKGFSNLLFNKWEFLDIKKLRQGVVHRGKDYEIIAFRTKHNITSYGFVFKEQDRILFNEKKAKKLGIRGELFAKILEKGELRLGNKIVKLSDVSYVRKGIKVVYTSDTMYSENVIKYAENADLLIHEATFDESLEDEAIKRAHSTVKDAALVAKKARVKMLMLTHFSSRYRETDGMLAQVKKYFDNVVCAEDGMKVVIRPHRRNKIIDISK